MVMKNAGRKIYRTANGKHIDLDMLISRNELTPAVGNAKVNARGDELGTGGKIVRKREDILRDYYNSSTGVPNEPARKKSEAVVADEPTVVAETPTKRQGRSTAVKNLPTSEELAEWEEDDEGNFVKKGNK